MIHFITSPIFIRQTRSKPIFLQKFQASKFTFSFFFSTFEFPCLWITDSNPVDLLKFDVEIFPQFVCLSLTNSIFYKKKFFSVANMVGQKKNHLALLICKLTCLLATPIQLVTDVQKSFSLVCSNKDVFKGRAKNFFFIYLKNYF